jgi:lipoyl(octanoyl) transferase
VASIGLRLRRGGSYHGVAINVDLDLAPFSRINPCGYEALPMTRICDLRAGAMVASVMPDYRQVLLKCLSLRQYDSSNAVAL